MVLCVWRGQHWGALLVKGGVQVLLAEPLVYALHLLLPRLHLSQSQSMRGMRTGNMVMPRSNHDMNHELHHDMNHELLLRIVGTGLYRISATLSVSRHSSSLHRSMSD